MAARTPKPKTVAERAREEQAKRLVKLGHAIRVARTNQMITQAELGAGLENYLGEPLPQTSISRWEAGMVSVDVEQVYAIERVLRIEPGTILRTAGYVPVDVSPRDVETMLRTDPNIDPDLRDGVVNIYRQYLQTSRTMGRRQQASA